MGDGNVTAPATDAARAWSGWGTALKPAWEPILLARKPVAGTVAANVQTHGTGALNIDGCRVGSGGQLQWETAPGMGYGGAFRAATLVPGQSTSGRWPANVLLDEAAAELLDEMSGTLRSGAWNGETTGATQTRGVAIYGKKAARPYVREADSGGASRFFYCAKASRSDRGEGNTHPTVKPTALMRWLVRLVTPPGGLVLDPFTGSGSTGVACVHESMRFIGIEQVEEYADMAMQRLRAVRKAQREAVK